MPSFHARSTGGSDARRQSPVDSESQWLAQKAVEALGARLYRHAAVAGGAGSFDLTQRGRVAAQWRR